MPNHQPIRVFASSAGPRGRVTAVAPDGERFTIDYPATGRAPRDAVLAVFPAYPVDPLAEQYGRWKRSGDTSWSLKISEERAGRGYELGRVYAEFGGVDGWDIGGWWDDEPGGLTPQDLRDAADIAEAWEQQHG